MELLIAFDLCAILLYTFCGVHAAVRRGTRNKQNSVFLILIAVGILSAVCAVISNVIQTTPSLQGHNGRNILYISLLMYFALHAAMPAVYAMYIRILIGLDANTTPRKELLFFTPMLIAELMVCLNPFLHWIYVINEAGRFERAYMETGIYAIALFYLFFALYSLVRYHNSLTRRLRVALVIYYSLTLIGIVIQALFSGIKVELFFEALSCLGLMLTFEEDEVKHDVVTGLYNRMAFRQDNTRLLGALQDYFIINVKFLNLRFYARIMDVEGFQEMLRSIASWMRTLRKKCDVYHFGEDFTMILYGASEAEVQELTEVMKRKFDMIWRVGHVEAQFQVFITVAKSLEDFQTLDNVMDMVEYEPEHTGAHVTIQYRESLTYVQREAAVERALRNAVTNRSFQVYYQPIYNCETGTVTCSEALVRLFDDELGNIPPGEFIPIAEKSALIVEIGNIVFEKVCRFIHEQRPEQYGIEYTEVNLSVAQFMHSNLVEHFAKTLQSYGIDAGSINLEITESVAADSTEPFMLAVKQLENMGFTFSMDDYGTGYANVSSILNVNFKNIKMDKSFLVRALENEANATILKDTARLIRHLGRNVLQEGVETRDELNFVQDAGCNYVQGYYFSKPLPEADFIQYIKKFNRTGAA